MIYELLGNYTKSPKPIVLDGFEYIVVNQNYEMVARSQNLVDVVYYPQASSFLEHNDNPREVLLSFRASCTHDLCLFMDGLPNTNPELYI